MSKQTLATANSILNRVAAEVGLEPVADPFASTDSAFIQMQHLLNTAGDELAQAYPWELLTKEHGITTVAGDTGDYDLPDDFRYMMNQTGWDRSENVPLAGPLSPQDWQYLKGRDLVSSTIYASFRINEGLFKLFPQPPPAGLEIYFEYVSKNWVIDSSEATPTYIDEVMQGTDTPLYDKTLLSRYLKVKFLDSKGFNSNKAQDDFNQTFSFLTGVDKGAGILTAGGGGGFPYINMWRNIPDTRYGNS